MHPSISPEHPFPISIRSGISIRSSHGGDREASTDCWSPRKRHVSSSPVCYQSRHRLVARSVALKKAGGLQESAPFSASVPPKAMIGSMQCSSPQESPSWVSSQVCFNFKDGSKSRPRAGGLQESTTFVSARQGSHKDGSCKVCVHMYTCTPVCRA